MISRRRVLTAGTACAIVSQAMAGVARAQDGVQATGGHPVMERLLRSRLEQPTTTAQAAALRGTLHRLSTTIIPAQGRLVLVNSASCTLDAYQDGIPVMSMRVGCGSTRLATPQLHDDVGMVLLNPDWTLPPSVLHDPAWRRALADPVFFRQWGFAHHGTTIVQAPGPRNLLGRLKIRLAGGGSIYLHDTNERDSFHLVERHITHGCVRLQHPVALASWMLDQSKDDMETLIEQKSRKTFRPGTPCAVTLAYFTAWPDAEGRVAFHSDHYGLDGGAFIVDHLPQSKPSW